MQSPHKNSLIPYLLQKEILLPYLYPVNESLCETTGRVSKEPKKQIKQSAVARTFNRSIIVLH